MEKTYGSDHFDSDIGTGTDSLSVRRVTYECALRECGGDGGEEDCDGGEAGEKLHGN